MPDTSPATIQAVLKMISDELLRQLILLAMDEQRRRTRAMVAKCHERPKLGLPNVIFKNVSEK